MCGGIERNVLTLMERLELPGWDVQLALLDPRGELYETSHHKRRILKPRWGRFLYWLARPGPVRKFLIDVYYGFRLQWLLLTVRPDVLVTTCLDSIVVAGFTWKLGARWIGRVSSDLHEHLKRVLPRFERPLHRLLSYVYRRPHYLVAASHGLRQVLIDFFHMPANRCFTIYDMIDVERVRALSLAPMEHPLPEPFVLGVGRLVAAKGFDRLLHAAARIDLRNHSLVFLGTGPERARLESLARSLGLADRMCIIPFVSNPWAYMRRATLVVAPSRAEGFACAIAEAQACGATLVVSDCPHGPREIVKAGVTAEVVPQGDVQALAGALDRLLGDARERARYGTLASQSVELYDVRSVSAMWREVLERAWPA